MGQAKQRGSFEQRKAESIQKKKDERERKIREEKEWFDSLTEEEKATVRRNLEIREENRRALGMWMGAVGGLAGGFKFYKY